MMNVTDPKVHMAQVTAGEARELYSANPVILLPMGSHEDQGPHGPMGDYLLADRKFQELVINHPDSRYADDSYYYSGLCQLELGNEEQAQKSFAKVESIFKKSWRTIFQRFRSARSTYSVRSR